jgi:hypothetical protein
MTSVTKIVRVPESPKAFQVYDDAGDLAIVRLYAVSYGNHVYRQWQGWAGYRAGVLYVAPRRGFDVPEPDSTIAEYMRVDIEAHEARV